ncbi:TPA: toprim domain-containing protein [Streptococcus pyogenes]|nr:toprim domain-containing protein [Streptococcus pyogenes]
MKGTFMAEENAQQPSLRGKSRRERVEFARSRDILDVAHELNMELFRDGKNYRWKEHDSMVITPATNQWYWFSQRQGGDVIALVETIKEIGFNQAFEYLNEGTFKEFTVVNQVKEPFSYYLEPYEQLFVEARRYLKENRGLSDDTIDFFYDKGVLAQANAKVGDMIEPVLVFKNLDKNGQVVGAALQGLVAAPDKYFGRGYLKQIMKNSQPYNGMHVDIGTPNRLVFAESSIDLMSYYEIHKDSLSDVRLVSLEGLKTGTIGRHLIQLRAEMERRPLSSSWTDEILAQGLDEAVKQGYFKDGKNSHLLTLAVDNDVKGKQLIEELKDKSIPVIDATPPKAEGQSKMDWNAYLQETKATFSTEKYQEKIDHLISDVILGDETYYLWHDDELVNLGAGDSIIQAFHHQLEDRRYVINQAELYVEESSNDGATGYLSIEGHVLDKDGISDYLSDQALTDAEKVAFLETLQTELPDIWDEIVNHYDKVFEEVVVKYGLREKHADIIQEQELDLDPLVVPEAKEKSLEMNQETNTGGELFNRNSSFLGEDSPGTAPQPVEPTAQPDFPTNVHLHFTTDDGNMSNKAFRKNMRTLNLYANTMRDSAQWYLSEIADTTMSYVYKTPHEEGVQVLSVHFGKKNWMHLTGVTPVYENWVDSLSEQFIDDIANSKGHFKNLKFALGTPDKLKVLNLLPEIIESDTFVFNDLSSVQKLNNLDLSQALNPEDSDLLLLFRDEGLHQVPASLMRIKGDLEEKLSHIDSGTVLGVYRERNGQLEQVSVNEEYVKDGGQEMLSILQNKHYGEALDSGQEMVQTDGFSAEDFTKVLDAVYHIGVPDDLARVPEGVLPVWQKYLEVSEENQWDLEQMIDYADKNSLLVKDSAFYKEWKEDMIYKNDYHVRLQFAENWDNGVELPFRTEQLIDYKTFVTGLYEANQAHHQRRQESQLPYTKTEFDIYAPGGQLIKDNVHYAIGDETRPVSQLMGLGYRRLPGYQELAAIDNSILSQLENKELNQEIASEANEHSLNSQEIPKEDNYPREAFTSPKQDIKKGLAQRVEEIVAEDATKILVSSIPQVQENLSVEGNLVGTPQADNRMLYTNLEDFGKDYQLELAVYSPKRVDFLEDVQAPWTLALIRKEKKIGYLAYGSDWAKEFQIEEELKHLAAQIGDEKVPEGLYKQAEVEVFIASHQGNESLQEPIPTIVAEPFDYTSASAYEISEHAFQKIREYTQSPEDLLEYMDFMSKFPQLSPRNVALIHEQWRGANAVATYEQWKAMGEALGIKPDDVVQTKATYVNKRTGETKEVDHQGLSVKTGEKSKITLFRPLMAKMIPVLDENGQQLKNDKGNPKYKKLSEASLQEKALVKDGKLPVHQFQERDSKTGQPRFTTYKVFELSQTTLKPGSYPKAMPNRHFNFNVDKVKTKEVLEGLCDYAEKIGVSLMKDDAHVLDNAKGAFYSEEQPILINPNNTPGEKIATTIHELAHATLHNPKLEKQYKELPKGQKEFEAEMTSYLLSKHFGLDTSEKAIHYMASWTDNLKALEDKQLADSLKRVHQTVSKMLKQVEKYTNPHQLGRWKEHGLNFPKAPTKGLSR